MKPGRSVTSPRSITSAPAGTATLMPAILLPVTTIVPLRMTSFEVPSNSRAAFRAIVFGCAVREAVRRRSARARNAFFIARQGSKESGARAGKPAPHEEVLEEHAVSLPTSAVLPSAGHVHVIAGAETPDVHGATGVHVPYVDADHPAGAVSTHLEVVVVAVDGLHGARQGVFGRVRIHRLAVVRTVVRSAEIRRTIDGRSAEH